MPSALLLDARMLSIATDHLTAEFLHPWDDRHRLGNRYCHGGYLWQVRGADGAAWLSGPRYPSPTPPIFDGQGAPEAFRWFDLTKERRLNQRGDKGLMLGVGICDGFASREPSVLLPCLWEVESEATSCRMTTSQSFEDLGYRLERTWTAEGRRLTSFSRVQNTGAADLEVHWFPHPFLPLIQGVLDFSVDPRWTLPDELPYLTQAPGEFRMNPAHAWKSRNTFRILQGGPSQPYRASFAHPLVGRVYMEGDFPVDILPVWANTRTFSIEPHSIHRLAHGESVAWTLAYTFGQD
jgi:hypothetical protein